VHRARLDGVSGYTFLKLVSLWMNGFTAFSVKPLRIASFLGFASALFGLGLGVWVVFKKLFVNPDVPAGYSSLMSVILFVGGVLMLILGLIGEYIGRIYICLNRSPQYVIAKETTKK
jgi:undecaprenyl-phosphate 4-deoxy-4-formamido-L-arabinose transferase